MTTKVSSKLLRGHFETVAAMVADTDLKEGDFVQVERYAAGNTAGVLYFKVVASGTGTPDGGEYIDLPNTTPTTQANQIFGTVIYSKQWNPALTGTPEGQVVGDIGQLYVRHDGGAGTTLYVKESGDGLNTGWVAK